jgi:tight adherence protein B
MTLALFTFGMTLVVMLGLYWAFVVRPETERSRALARRVRRVDDAPSTDTTVSAPVATTSVVDVLLASNVRVAARLKAILVEANVTWTTAGLAARVALAAAIGAIAGMLVAGSPYGLVLGVLTSAVPYVYVLRRRRVRLDAFEEQFPEAIDLIARSLRAGHTFTTGLGIAAEEIPAPVGPEFRRVYDEQNFGMAMPDALRAMALRVPVLDARFFVTAVLTQREAGGNLAEVLDNLSGVMRDRFKVRRQIRVVSAHGRITAWILSLLPPLLALILYLVAPRTMNEFLADPYGQRLIVVAVGLELLGSFIISRLVDVEY